MGIEDSGRYGQTILEEEVREGLLISSIETKEELDVYEQKNIEEAILWIMLTEFKTDSLFSIDFVKELHKKMFGSVWEWAGEFRKTNKNIGIDKWQIATELKYLIDNALYWKENSIYSSDELAIRFKHRLVSIHCFPNGNGRHSRLMADLIIEKVFQRPVFTWGLNLPSDSITVRASYLNAIRAADKGDFSALLSFARS